jgi:hypothetical protein
MTWYKKELIRNLVDMHIPNGEGYLEKFDPAAYAENIKKSGATVAYIYGSNCLGLCFYPTNIGLRHKQAERDIFGETVKECRKRGLKVVGYLNSWGSFVADNHPEWAVRFGSGKQRRDYERFGTPCINNEAYENYFTSLVYEFVSRHKLDGLWVDMIGIYAPVCYCEACKEKYGKELPTVVNIDDPKFIEYLRFKSECVADYVEKIQQAAKSADPNITISLQATGIKAPMGYGLTSSRYYDVPDYLAGDFYETREGVNVISRMMYKYSNNLPFEFMTSRCVSLERHTMNKNIHEILQQAYASIMYKGAFLFIDAIDPDGEMNSEFYDEIAVLSEQIKPYLVYADFEEKPIREVAVFHNFFSGISSEVNGLPIDKSMPYKSLLDKLKKIDATMSKAGIDYDIITMKNEKEFTNYKVIILPSLEMLGEDEVETIRNYVANGGKIYVSGISSIRDDRGNRYENFMLHDVLGLDYQGKFEIGPSYIAPEDEYQSLFGKYTKKHPHMLEERFVKVVPTSNGKTIAKVTLPISDVKDIHTFSSAISNPPIIYTDYPAIYENTYGKGIAIYAAGEIEKDGFEANQMLFADLIRYMLGEEKVKVTAPSCVDHVVYENEKDYKVNLLNSQTIYPPIPISNIEVKVKVDSQKIQEVLDVSGGQTEWKVEDGILKIKTDLNVYKMLIVKKV